MAPPYVGGGGVKHHPDVPVFQLHIPLPNTGNISFQSAPQVQSAQTPSFGVIPALGNPSIAVGGSLFS
jgi:hypothetical protein